MTYDALLATSPILFAAVLNGGLAIYSWRLRDRSGTKTFAGLMAAVAFWSVTYFAEVLVPGLRAKLFFNDLKYLGIDFSAPLWLMFAVIYTQRRRWLGKRGHFLLLFGLAPLAFMVTNSWHHLWLYDPRLVEAGPLTLLEVSYGPLFWLNMAVIYGLILTGIMLYFIHFLQAPQIFRKQTGLILLAALLPLLGNILFLSGKESIPFGLDITPVLLGITGLLMVLATVRYQFLELMPVARRQIVDSMTDGVIVVDPRNRIVDLNPRACEIIQVDRRRKTVGQPLDQALGNCPPLRDLMASTSEAIDTFCHRQMTCEHRDMVIDVLVSPLSRWQENPAGFLIILRDVTQQVNSNAELLRIKEFNETIVQHMLDGIILDDADGNITYANPSALQLLEYSSQQLLGQHYETLVAPDEIEKIRRETAARRHGNYGRYQTWLVTKTDQRLPVIVSATPLLANGVFQGSLAVFTDISDRVRLEEAQRSMIAMASHDLQSPLQVIRGYLEIVINDPGMDAETRNAYLGNALIGAERIQTLAQDLLDLTTIESGELELTPECLSPDELISEAIGQFREQIRQRKLAATIDLAPHLPNVLADRRCLERILNNLISNAIKYTESGGFTINVTAHNSSVRITIQDTGIGIPPDHLNRVFERFHRVPGHQGIRGTGLGLAIVKELVERNNGRIWVESSGIPGQGSAFHFSLPAACHENDADG